MPTTAASKPKTPHWLHCDTCGHEWIAIYLPMEMAKAATLLRRLHCPMCGQDAKRLFMTAPPSTKRGRPHPHQALTEQQVKDAKGTGRKQTLADGGGLYLVVTASGSKHWVLRVVVNRKRCDIGLGGTAIVSLAEARAEAYRLRKIARTGGDPLAERRNKLGRAGS